MKLLQRIKTNTFYRIYILVLFPILVIAIFFMIITAYYNNTHKNLLKDMYSYRLEMVYQENESSIKEIISSIYSLSQNEQMMLFLNGVEQGTNATSYAVSMLKEIKKKHDIVDSIAFINRSGRTVVSNSGNTTLDKYLYEEYCYTDYNRDFWWYYQSPLSDIQVISPTTVNEWGIKKGILPVVFTQIGDTKISNPLVVNIDVFKILEKPNEKKLTASSNILIINNQTRRCFDLNERESDNYIDKIMHRNIISKTNDAFDYTLNGKNKVLIISHSPKQSLLGYSYATIIPYSDINQNISSLALFIGVAAILLIIILLTSYFSAKQIYNPMKKLAMLFKSSSQSNNEDMINYIHTSILEILNNKMDLTEQYAMALPLIQEKYLINLLNSNDYYAGEEENEFISQAFVQFKHDYFISIVIKLRPTDKFFDNYCNTQYSLIQTAVYNMIKSFFDEKYDTFIVSSEKDTLYTLLNLEDDNQYDDIIGILETFKKIMDNDRDFIILYIGVGNIYKGIDGLKRTHDEAVKSVSTIPRLNQFTIKTYSPPKQEMSYVFNINDENTLLNYLLAGYFDDAKKLINTTIESGISNNISEGAMLQLNVQVINVIFKVMRMRRIPYDEANSGDFSIITDIIGHVPNEVYDIIMQFIEKIEKSITVINSKVDIKNVIKYIENNYNSDLCLKGLAQEFGTTEKYISKLIKNKLDISFHEYLSNFRINRAKILLIETNKNITKIYSEIGFNNRNTFVRIFRKTMGITPTEYRKINSKNKKPSH